MPQRKKPIILVSPLVAGRNKVLTYQAQFVSSVCFLFLALLLPIYYNLPQQQQQQHAGALRQELELELESNRLFWLQVMFLVESVGQFLLAWASYCSFNAKSTKHPTSKNEIVYFENNEKGRAAYAVFGVVVLARYMLAYNHLRLMSSRSTSPTSTSSSASPTSWTAVFELLFASDFSFALFSTVVYWLGCVMVLMYVLRGAYLHVKQQKIAVLAAVSLWVSSMLLALCLSFSTTSSATAGDAMASSSTVRWSLHLCWPHILYALLLIPGALCFSEHVWKAEVINIMLWVFMFLIRM